MLYDAIIVLGSRPDEKTWEFPSHVVASLEKAAKLYKNGATEKIAVSGNHALWFDRNGIRQPQTEADMMATYLRGIGVPENAIMREGESKDTIANLYYLKQKVLEPHKMTRLLFIAGDFRLERLQYLVRKILGPAYHVTFQTVSSAPDEKEATILAKTKFYLNAMKPGDDHFLDGWFYDNPIYTQPWPEA